MAYQSGYADGYADPAPPVTTPHITTPVYATTVRTCAAAAAVTADGSTFVEVS